jgi:hypothetical protein
MRCPDCNKFVSYDEPEVEVESAELDGDGIHVNARVILKCGECGTELKDAEIEGSIDIEHECAEDGKPDDGFAEGEDQFEIEENPDAEPTDRLQDKDRHGKPIKSFRYMKKFYGFSSDVPCHCKKCGEDFTVTVSGEEQASGFNECC